jgi:putative hemolysin
MMDFNQLEAPRIFELPVHKFRTRVLRFFIRLIKRPFESLSGLRDMDRIYARAWKMPKDIPFCDRALQASGVRAGVAEEELARVPKEGAVVVVANHPFGGIEGIILLSLMKRVRPDVKAMANYLLSAIPEMRDDFIFVDPFASKNSAKANLRPIKESLGWLKEGHLLIVFPSGEVSSFDRRTLRVRDPAWSASIAALVRKTNATVVPMFFPGRNSVAFNLAGFIHPRLRTLLLPRQLSNKKGRTLTVRIGTPLNSKALEPFSMDDVQLIKYMRFRSYLLAERETHRTRHFISLNPPMMPPDPIVAPIASEVLAAEIARLPESSRLIAAGDFACTSRLPRRFRRVCARSGVCARAPSGRSARARATRSIWTSSTSITRTFSCGTRRGRRSWAPTGWGWWTRFWRRRGSRGFTRGRSSSSTSGSSRRCRLPSRWGGRSSAPSIRRPTPRCFCCGGAFRRSSGKTPITACCSGR